MTDGAETGLGAPRRSPNSATAASYRRIASLALPALVVLAAEPVYILIDTAVVGHLGAIPLAALAAGSAVIGVTVWIASVLAYGTTSRAARRFGAGDRAGAVAEGVQGTWVAIVAGLAVVAIVQVAAGPLMRAVADDHDVASAAESWLRIAVFGVPFLLMSASGQGWMRALQDTRRPMYFVCFAFLVSAVLAPILVYPVGLGLVGSAWANVVAQTIAGTLFLRALRRQATGLRPDRALMRKQLIANRDLIIRGAAMQASFQSATLVAARLGPAALGAHQIGIQLWFFLALALDGIAIAAQALVGADLGAGNGDDARASAKRLTWIGFAFGALLLLASLASVPFLPSVFTSDAAVVDRLGEVWPWLLVLLPAAGVVFALDGVLIGAGDLRFMRDMNVAAALSWLPFTWLTLTFDWGLTGVWGGLAVFMTVRLALILWRMRSGAWAVTGIERG